VVAATPLAGSTSSDHDSPNATATALSVYVIVRPAATENAACTLALGLGLGEAVAHAAGTQPPVTGYGGKPLQFSGGGRTSIHASTVPLLSPNSINYRAHRFRLCQQFDACSLL
tara:strand:- start:146 stop:487 length:342 start_codon:yes stop_codon:yes gene_type:complete